MIRAMALAVPLLAASLGAYTEWPDTPQGYFMTRGERAEWSTLRSEADAARFVSQFIARRGPRFAESVAAAAKAADDNFSFRKSPGSKTLRGKIVILLGPPSSFTISQRNRDGTATKAGNSTHVSPWRPQTVHVTAGSWPSSEMRAKYADDYIFKYAKETLPGNPAEDRTIVVAVNPATGEDRILDARMAREVNELLEAAAEAHPTLANHSRR